MSKLNTNMGGFSAIELLITLIIIGVAFLAFTTSFTTIQNINKISVDINTANTAAFAKVQEYENKLWASLPTTSPQGSLQQVEDFSSSLATTLPSPKSAIVYINTSSPTLKQIVVNIQFGSGGSQRTVQYADFIQKNGL